MSEKYTAVEFLENNLDIHEANRIFEIIQKAKEMEKEQIQQTHKYDIIDAFNLKELFVPYDMAKELKSLNFKEPCFKSYLKDSDNILEGVGDKYNIPAPLFSQVFNWFSKKHQLFSIISIDKTSYPKYAYEILSFFGNPKDLAEREWGWKKNIPSHFLYKKKYEAEVDCIEEMIEIVKKNK
jgi:hypothetical protein